MIIPEQIIATATIVMTPAYWLPVAWAVGLLCGFVIALLGRRL